MCFVCEKSDFQIPTAGEDILVHKLIDYHPELGFIASFVGQNTSFHPIGFYRYNKKLQPPVELNPVSRFSDQIEIYEGYHSYHEKIRSTPFYSSLLVEAWIPAGAQYVTNGREYVSSQLRLGEKVLGTGRGIFDNWNSLEEKLKNLPYE